MENIYNRHITALDFQRIRRYNLADHVGGLPYCDLGAYMRLSDVSFDINKGSSALHDRKNTGYKFVSDDINNGHPAFAFVQSAPVIFLKLRIGMDSTDGRQMQHLLHLLISNLTDLRPSSNTCSRSILKRSRAGITGKLSPVIKSGKITGVNDQVRGDDKSDALNRGNQLKSDP